MPFHRFLPIKYTRWQRRRHCVCFLFPWCYYEKHLIFARRWFTRECVTSLKVCVACSTLQFNHVSNYGMHRACQERPTWYSSPIECFPELLGRGRNTTSLSWSFSAIQSCSAFLSIRRLSPYERRFTYSVSHWSPTMRIHTIRGTSSSMSESNVSHARIHSPIRKSMTSAHF